MSIDVSPPPAFAPRSLDGNGHSSKLEQPISWGSTLLSLRLQRPGLASTFIHGHGGGAMPPPKRRRTRRLRLAVVARTEP